MTGHAIGDALPQLSPTMIERCGPGTYVSVAGEAGREHACGVGRFHAHEGRRRGTARAAVVGDARGGQCTDPRRDEYDVGSRCVRPGERVLDLEEDRGVALDDVTRWFRVALPRRVGDHQRPRAGRGRRTRDRIVIGAIDDLDGCALALDAGDPGRDHVRGHEDARVEPEQASHGRDGAAVIAVGGGRERQRSERLDRIGELVHGRPLGLAPEAIDDGAVRGPGSTEHLERGQAEPVRFHLHEHASDRERVREAGRLHQRRRLVAGKPGVHGERRARGGQRDRSACHHRIAQDAFAHGDQSANASIMARTSSPSG